MFFAKYLKLTYTNVAVLMQPNEADIVNGEFCISQECDLDNDDCNFADTLFGGDSRKYVRLGRINELTYYVPLTSSNCTSAILQEPLQSLFMRLTSANYTDFLASFFDLLPRFVNLYDYLDLMSRKLMEFGTHDSMFEKLAARILHLSLCIRILATVNRSSRDFFVITLHRGEETISVQINGIDEIKTAIYLDHAKNWMRSEVLAALYDMREYLDGFIEQSLTYCSYFSLRTFERSYLKHDALTGGLVELPIWLFARVSAELNTAAPTVVCDMYLPLRELREKYNARYFGDRTLDEKNFRQCFEAMLRRKYIHATPTLINSGMQEHVQLSSCFLHGQVPSSPREDTFDSIADMMKIMQQCGGVGVSLNNHADVVSIARAIDTGMSLVQQRRPSALALYLDVSNFDVYRFLELRRNVGRADEQCQRVFTAVMLNDLFMRRVLQNGNWLLMHPDKVGDLNLYYGEAYTKRYEHLELKMLAYGVRDRDYYSTNAKELFTAIMRSQIETGMPFVCHRDAINRASPHVHTPRSYLPNLCRGTVSCCNLCTEITQYSDEHEYGVCNLANLALTNFVNETYVDNSVNVELTTLMEGFTAIAFSIDHITDSQKRLFNYIDKCINWTDLERIARLAVRMLNRALLHTHVRLLQAQRGIFHQRSIALGVQGFAELLQRLSIPYDSLLARLLNVVLFNFLYTVANDESVNVCRDDNYENDNDYISGEFDHPTVHSFWMNKRSSTVADASCTRVEIEAAFANQMTASLRRVSEQYITNLMELHRRCAVPTVGLRRRANSLLIGLMPTATTSQILGNSESFDPLYSNIFHRNTLAGDFVQYNERLLDAMAAHHPKRGKITRYDLVKELIECGGSSERILYLPPFQRRIFVSAMDVSMRAIIDLCADRQQWVDQTQSMSLYMKKNNRDCSRLYLALVYGWARCLKTGMYYLRTYDEKTDRAILPNIASRKRCHDSDNSCCA